MAQRLKLTGSRYKRMLVEDGEIHSLGVRVLDRLERTRWRVQQCVQDAVNFTANRGSTKRPHASGAGVEQPTRKNRAPLSWYRPCAPG